MNSSTIILALVVLALCLYFKVPGIGRLPFDFQWRAGNLQIFAPIMSMLVISLIISLLRNIFH